MQAVPTRAWIKLERPTPLGSSMAAMQHPAGGAELSCWAAARVYTYRILQPFPKQKTHKFLSSPANGYMKNTRNRVWRPVFSVCTEFKGQTRIDKWRRYNIRDRKLQKAAEVTELNLLWTRHSDDEVTVVHKVLKSSMCSYGYIHDVRVMMLQLRTHDQVGYIQEKNIYILLKINTIVHLNNVLNSSSIFMGED
jgi:hypothetical protein